MIYRQQKRKPNIPHFSVPAERYVGRKKSQAILFVTSERYVGSNMILCIDKVDRSPIKILPLKGCRMEAVAPTKEGYKRTAGSKA